MEVGCPRHPGISTIGIQLLDGDHSHGWQNQATQPWAPTWKEKKQAPVTLIKQWKEKGRDRGGETASKESPCSGETLTLEKRWLKRNPNPKMLCGARAQGILAHELNKPLTALVKLVLLVVNSVKLYLTAFIFHFSAVLKEKKRIF